jgi:hypothetical protein
MGVLEFIGVDGSLLCYMLLFGGSHFGWLVQTTTVEGKKMTIFFFCKESWPSVLCHEDNLHPITLFGVRPENKLRLSILRLVSETEPLLWGSGNLWTWKLERVRGMQKKTPV